jgi:hypothetical protein
MAHVRPFWISTLQDLSNSIKNTSMQGFFTPTIKLWIFGSPEGLQVPTFGSVTFILTLTSKWGCNNIWILSPTFCMVVAQALLTRILTHFLKLKLNFSFNQSEWISNSFSLLLFFLFPPLFPWLVLLLPRCRHGQVDKKCSLSPKITSRQFFFLMHWK